MCAGAMINARVATCYFGATDPKAGVAGTFYNLLADTRFNHQVAVVSGIKADESSNWITFTLGDVFDGVKVTVE